jgi:hypothetical protein
MIEALVPFEHFAVHRLERIGHLLRLVRNRRRVRRWLKPGARISRF